MSEEFNLSEKIRTVERYMDEDLWCRQALGIKDVREFIKRLKERFDKCLVEDINSPDVSVNASRIIQNYIDAVKDIDKLAGEKLI